MTPQIGSENPEFENVNSSHSQRSTGVVQKIEFSWSLQESAVSINSWALLEVLAGGISFLFNSNVIS